MHTISLIKDFFGEDSIEYQGSLRFAYVRQVDYNKVETNKDVITQFLNNCIETIERKGLYKKSKTNFLYRLNDTWLICIITVIIPAIFIGGYKLGRYMESSNKSTISIPALPNSKPIPKIK